MSMEARIASGLTALGLTPPAGAAARLAEYGRLLLEQNQVMNLKIGRASCRERV